MDRRALDWPRFVVAALFCGLLAAVVRLAWLSDDSYITLRTVENLLAGHGPVWNVGERVQTYTHPAWFWLLVGARWLSGEHYFATIVLSVVLSMAAVATLVGLARRPFAAIAILSAALGSRAFGDFATSGLETPLAMLLLALLGHVDANTPPGGARPAAVCTVIGACGLTRLDLLLVAGPVLLGHLRRAAGFRQFGSILVAFVPLAAWLAFAAAYYGSPFPITAYAKAIATELPPSDLWGQGWKYVVRTWDHDPLTLLVVAAGATCGVLHTALRARCSAIAIVLSCAYVVSVGGDFMVGRFFVPSFALALTVLARALAIASIRTQAAAVVLCLGVPWFAGAPAFLRSPAADMVATEGRDGIQDERRSYYRALGLWSPERTIPSPGFMTWALRRQGRSDPLVTTSSLAGQFPFAAGELFHFVDPWLCDPLLMRLPTIDTTGWRIGHFTRAIPDGYLETLAFGGDRIADENLRDYYATLRRVLRGSLSDSERWRALASLWSGAANRRRLEYTAGEYRKPHRREVPLAAIAAPCSDGSLWCDDAGIRLVGRGGLRITTQPTTAISMSVSVVPLTVYEFVFRDGAEEVGRTKLTALVDIPKPPDDANDDVYGYLRRMLGVHGFVVPIPADVPPFDTIDVNAAFGPWTIAGIAGVGFGR